MGAHRIDGAARGERAFKCLQIQCHTARIRGIVFDSLARTCLLPLYGNKGSTIECIIIGENQMN